jgi:hypothetical protein
LFNKYLFQTNKDNTELPPTIRFATDLEITTLPKSLPHCVPNEMQTFLAKFIQEFYRLFDTHGRGELYACYHDSCMLSLCITTIENSIVPIRQYRYGPLIYESRNLQKIVDDNRRCSLLRHGKTAVLDFLRVKFPLTKHDGNSFRVDVISTSVSCTKFYYSILCIIFYRIIELFLQSMVFIEKVNIHVIRRSCFL